MGAGNGVGGGWVGVGRGGASGVRHWQVGSEMGPCSRVRRAEVNEGSAYLLPVFDPSEKRRTSLSDGGRGKTRSGL